MMTQVFAQIPVQQYASARETLATHSRPGKIQDMYKDKVKADDQNEPVRDQIPTDPAEVNDAPLPADDSNASDNKIIRQFNVGMLQAVFYVATTVLWIKFLMPIMRQFKYALLHDGVREGFWDLAYVRFNDHALDFYTAAGILGTFLLFGALIIYGYSAYRYVKNNLIGLGQRFGRSHLARYIAIGGDLMRRTWLLWAVLAAVYFEGIEPQWFTDLANGKYGDAWDVAAIFAGFAAFTYIFVRVAFKQAWGKEKSNWQFIKEEVKKFMEDVAYTIKTGKIPFNEDDLGPRIDGLDEPSVTVAKKTDAGESVSPFSADIPFTIIYPSIDGEVKVTTITKGKVAEVTYSQTEFYEMQSLERDLQALMAA
jgi:hypothetical protein